jgi:hypothetical protein
MLPIDSSELRSRQGRGTQYSVRAIIILFEIHVNSARRPSGLSVHPPRALVREAGDGEFGDAGYDRALLAGSIDGGTTRCATACPR